ncbi:MAG: helix-turn-helix domain-containing protein [Firmicutes bacterium]|nr:helix-turn-helix domain-containing protein [Bacillota bacterium]
MEKILRYYKGYMLELCKFELYDAEGTAYTCYDEELYQELQIKLMRAIQTRFELR